MVVTRQMCTSCYFEFCSFFSQNKCSQQKLNVETWELLHADEQMFSLKNSARVANYKGVSKLPFGDRMLFLVRRPLINRGRRMGLGVFRRPRYLAKTPSRTTPADSDANTIYLNWKRPKINQIVAIKNEQFNFDVTFCVVVVCGTTLLPILLNSVIIG